MVAVAVAALNFGAIRAMDGPVPGRPHWVLGWGWDLGILPMANVLAVGLLVALRRPRHLPFLLGFEAFGAMALARYIVLVSHDAHSMESYLKRLDFIAVTIGPDRLFVLIPVVISAGVVMLGLPQLVFALVGGLLSQLVSAILSRRFGISITPR